MPNGTIVKIEADSANVYVSVVVTEGSRNVEYTGSVPLTGDLTAFGFANSQWSDLTNAQKKTALQNAVKAVRDQVMGNRIVVSGITGTVTL